MRILILDDEVDVRKAIRVMLAGAGFEVVEAGTGEEALRILDDLGADLLLCDIFLPGADGLEIIRTVRRQHPAVKIIAVSGGGPQAAHDLLPEAQLQGAVGVLYKPVDQTVALAAIKRVLPAAQAR
ncbi:MAG TPA: response regulator [Gemmataceae bacterium]|nr:response regulator [Gemmataceae bacterium]